MSAIGGYYDRMGRTQDFSGLHRMSRDMILRGRLGAVAWLYGRSAVFCNRNGTDGGGIQREGIAAVMDGGGEDSLEELIRSYRRGGAEALTVPSEGFAFVLYDEEKKLLLMARDSKGCKPLYVTEADGTVFFASELRGLLAVSEKVGRIRQDALERHILAPMAGGVCRMYMETKEILPGECVILTERGRGSFFPRRWKEVPAGDAYMGEVLTLPPLKGELTLSETLRDALYAFEYPQFDPRMLALAPLLRSLASDGVARAAVEDAVQYEDLSYAREREDRLGAYFGVSLRGTVPKRCPAADSKALRAQEKAMLRMYEQIMAENDILLRLFGEDFLNTALAATVPSIRIRRLGMLLQIPMWIASSHLIFVLEQGRCFS